VTVVNFVASSFITLSEGAAEGAAARKESKYLSYEPAYLFQSVASKIIGPLNASATDFAESIGCRLRVLSDDSRETGFCFNVYLSACSVSIL
jgi:hypothetical protein